MSPGDDAVTSTVGDEDARGRRRGDALLGDWARYGPLQRARLLSDVPFGHGQ